MNSNRHPSEIDLALYSNGDQPFVAKLKTAAHVRACADCRTRVASYRADRKVASTIALTMPRDLDWDRLAAEMNANIRVGLAAGECVAPFATKPEPSKRIFPKSWQQGLAYAAVAVVVLGSWWATTPAAETSAIGRVTRALWTQTPVAMLAEPGVTVEASPGGVLVKENGSSMALTSPGNRPVALSVSLQGSARARYMDDDTGQMTITTVYVQ